LNSVSAKTGASNAQPAGHLWPAKAFCATRYALGKISNNEHLSYLFNSSVFKIAWPASEQVRFKLT